MVQKYPFCSNVQFKYQNWRVLRAFLRVKFGLKVFLRVKELTFCNSALLRQTKELDNKQFLGKSPAAVKG